MGHSYSMVGNGCISIFGDLNKIDANGKIKEFINQKGLQIIDFKGIDVIDYGGLVEINE